MEQMYSLPTVAKMWDMSVRTLRRLLMEANIDLHKIGSRMKVKESDLLKLIVSSEEFDEMDSYL
ncbi:MAG: helix-turn-helix domain-containing protein [Candidatus Marinimicrobia bacterium]|nr:helix-turn-helix domain-containing protein [Candidatus Neomarinimicrobiota bacterium]